MKPEIKKKWLTALRSGNYSQGTGSLCVINPKTGKGKYCCVGVLAGEMGVLEFRHNECFKGVGLDKSTGRLTDHLRRKFGISWDEESTVVTLNDSKGKNFNEIADWIEENL